MQKRPLSQISISYYEMKFPDDFPVSFERHIQRYQSGGSLHFHNGLEIGFCYEGSGLFFVDNSIIPFGAGDVSFIFQDQPHIAQSPDENPSYWGFITVDIERLFCDTVGYKAIAELLHIKHSIPNILLKNENENISAIVRMIGDEVEKQLPNYRQTVKNLLWVLLLMAARLSEIDTTKKYGADQTSNDILRISPSINFISTHYQEDIPIGGLAMMCNLSSTHFRRVFKQTMGRTPSEYLIEVRMHMAKSMLKTTSATISEVAMSVGYETISNFNRQFRKSSNMTPRDYRNNFKKLENV